MRFPNGVNRDRFNLITAVLAKHARLKVRIPEGLPSAVTLCAILFNAGVCINDEWLNTETAQTFSMLLHTMSAL